MNTLIRHVEYLIRRHNCVVVPGLGAFLCNYVSARYSDNGIEIMPPGRSLAFHSHLTESDGMLERSIACRERISESQALRLIGKEVAALLTAVSNSGAAPFGVLGSFGLNSDGDITFAAAPDVAGINGPFFGLLPIAPKEMERQATPATITVTPPTESNREVCDYTQSLPRANRMAWFPPAWRAYASGIAASLAIVVTLAFFVMEPMRVSRPTDTASIAPLSTMHRPAAESSATATDTPAETSIASAETAPQEVVAAEQASAQNPNDAGVANEPLDTEIRLNNADKFIVVVASFPTMAQADAYIKASQYPKLAIARMDGRYRVYAATAPDYASATALAKGMAQADAWVCRLR